MSRGSRRRGAKNEATAIVLRVHDPESVTKLRYDCEAQCVHWRTMGTCADPRHRHSIRRNVEAAAELS